MSTTPMSYKMEDLVWAKMKGFSPWPAKVSEPPADLKKPKKPSHLYCIFFFGTNNYGWIEETNIKPYHEFKNTLTATSKSAAFKHACNMIELYDADPAKFNSEMGTSKIDNDFNRLRDNPEKIEKSEKTKKEKHAKKEKVKNIVSRKRSSSANGLPKKRARTLSGASIETIPNNPLVTPRSSYVKEMLNNRPDTVALAEPAPLDVASITQTLKDKNITASTLNFGFLGLGNIGQGIVKNLLNSGHSVTIWNRTASKCDSFVEAGAFLGLTPMDVVQASDITFSCVSDPQAAKDMVFGNCGVLNAALDGNKGYVEMTSIDSETSQDIADAIISKGGRYLEAQLQGSKEEAEMGNLIILAAGNKSLFDECQSCFQAMGKNSFFLAGEVGNASKMNCVLQLINGVTVAGLVEGMALADRAGLQKKDALEILTLTSFASKQLIEKSKIIISGVFETQTPVAHMQKDLKLALGMSESLEQPLPVAAAANEIYKHAKRLGYGDHDVSAIYIRARF